MAFEVSTDEEVDEDDAGKAEAGEDKAGGKRRKAKAHCTLHT